jgi:DNA-directed RNA polymerase specialized sigma24 family protein
VCSSDLSNPDFGERLDCSVEAVESLLARARHRLTVDMSKEREVFGND